MNSRDADATSNALHKADLDAICEYIRERDGEITPEAVVRAAFERDTQ